MEAGVRHLDYGSSIPGYKHYQRITFRQHRLLVTLYVTLKTHPISTLEAVAYALSSRFNADVTPLYRIQQRMQDFWQGPREHRR